MNENEIGDTLLGAAMKVHSALGPGLLESAYEICLVHEIGQRGLNVRRQVALPLIYDGIKLDAGYRLDLLINDQVIVELKSVGKFLPPAYCPVTELSEIERSQTGLFAQFQRGPHEGWNQAHCEWNVNL